MFCDCIASMTGLTHYSFYEWAESDIYTISKFPIAEAR